MHLNHIFMALSSHHGQTLLAVAIAASLFCLHNRQPCWNHWLLDLRMCSQVELKISTRVAFITRMILPRSTERTLLPARPAPHSLARTEARSRSTSSKWRQSWIDSRSRLQFEFELYRFPVCFLILIKIYIISCLLRITFAVLPLPTMKRSMQRKSVRAWRIYQAAGCRGRTTIILSMVARKYRDIISLRDKRSYRSCWNIMLR